MPVRPACSISRQWSSPANRCLVLQSLARHQGAHGHASKSLESIRPPCPIPEWPSPSALVDQTLPPHSLEQLPPSADPLPVGSETQKPKDDWYTYQGALVARPAILQPDTVDTSISRAQHHARTSESVARVRSNIDAGGLASADYPTDHHAISDHEAATDHHAISDHQALPDDEALPGRTANAQSALVDTSIPGDASIPHVRPIARSAESAILGAQASYIGGSLPRGRDSGAALSEDPDAALARDPYLEDEEDLEMSMPDAMHITGIAHAAPRSGSNNRAGLSSSESPATTFDWLAYLDYNPDVARSYSSQTLAQHHFVWRGMAEKRLAQRIPLVLRYSACGGLMNQHYSHVAAFSIARLLGAGASAPYVSSLPWSRFRSAIMPSRSPVTGFSNMCTRSPLARLRGHFHLLHCTLAMVPTSKPGVPESWSQLATGEHEADGLVGNCADVAMPVSLTRDSFSSYYNLDASKNKVTWSPLSQGSMYNLQRVQRNAKGAFFCKDLCCSSTWDTLACTPGAWYCGTRTTANSQTPRLALGFLTAWPACICNITNVGC